MNRQRGRGFPLPLARLKGRSAMATQVFDEIQFGLLDVIDSSTDLAETLDGIDPATITPERFEVFRRTMTEYVRQVIAKCRADILLFDELQKHTRGG